MSSSTQPRYYLFGLSPLAFLLSPLWISALAYVALIFGVYLFAPPDQESVVAESVGYAIGTGLVNMLLGGSFFIAIHALISLIVNAIFALCYFSIILFSRLWT